MGAHRPSQTWECIQPTRMDTCARVITATAVRGLPHCVGRGDCPVQPAMTPHAANSAQHATAATHHVVQAVLTPAPCRPHAAGSGMQGTLRSDATEGLNGCGRPVSSSTFAG